MAATLCRVNIIMSVLCVKCLGIHSFHIKQTPESRRMPIHAQILCASQCYNYSLKVKCEMRFCRISATCSPCIFRCCLSRTVRLAIFETFLLLWCSHRMLVLLVKYRNRYRYRSTCMPWVHINVHNWADIMNSRPLISVMKCKVSVSCCRGAMSRWCSRVGILSVLFVLPE